MSDPCPTHTPPASSPHYAVICAALNETFGIDTAELRPDATFEELDVDSLALLEFALVMGERLGVTGETELRPGMTLAEATALVDASSVRS
ncbi:acyl carrier protein [Streptomyces sp. NPDC001739]|uniref:acyl carrier protein n=1 Tax=unclassified Streptomyces TaxID=2593676 RepID=UPI00068C858F|nr:acyl carrier protein [Streptomyces sp. NRRL S-1448]